MDNFVNVAGLSDACIETILHKPQTDFNVESGLFGCTGPIYDVATRRILKEIGIPALGPKLGADKHTSIEKIRDYGRRHLVDFDKNGKFQCSDLITLLFLGTNEVDTSVTIECSDFWTRYKNNAIFKKFITGHDVDTEEYPASDFLQLPLKSSRQNLPFTDTDFHRCGNSQCVLKSRTCNGVPECKDLSDEINCPTCPQGALACTVWGKKTCLPEDDLCRYQPESCEGKDVSFCAERTLDQKWESCCKKLATNTNVDIQRLCATNTEDLDSLTSQDDSYLFSSYWEFQHLSYNISICQDQVEALFFSCH